jgi:hypothetical protein
MLYVASTFLVGCGGGGSGGGRLAGESKRSLLKTPNKHRGAKLWTPLSPHFKGIHNFGASCFINAALQIVLHLGRPIDMYVANMKGWLREALSNPELMRMISDPVDPALMPDELARRNLEQQKQATRRHLKILEDFIKVYDHMHRSDPDYTDPVDGTGWYEPIVPDYFLRDQRSWGRYLGSQEDSGQAFESLLGSLADFDYSMLFKWASEIGDIPPYPGDGPSIDQLFKIFYSETNACLGPCNLPYTKPGEFQRVYTLAFPDAINVAYRQKLIVPGSKVEPIPVVSLADMFEATLPLDEITDKTLVCEECRTIRDRGVPLAARDSEPPRHRRTRKVELVGPSPPILVLAINRLVTALTIDALGERVFKQGKIEAIVNIRPSRENTGNNCDLDLGAMPHSRAIGCYKLVGIVVHSGGAGGGHYYSAFLDQYSDHQGENWIIANDRSISTTDLDSFVASHESNEAVAVYKKLFEEPPIRRLPVPDGSAVALGPVESNAAEALTVAIS